MEEALNVASNSIGEAFASLLSTIESIIPHTSGGNASLSDNPIVKQIITILNAVEVTASINADISFGFSIAGLFTKDDGSSGLRWPTLEDFYVRINKFEVLVAAAVGPLSFHHLSIGIADVDVIDMQVNASMGVTLAKPIQLSVAQIIKFKMPQRTNDQFIFNGTLSARLPTLLTITEPRLAAITGGAGAVILISDNNLFDGKAPRVGNDVAITPPLADTFRGAFDGLKSWGDSISDSTVFNTALPLVKKVSYYLYLYLFIDLIFVC